MLKVNKINAQRFVKFTDRHFMLLNNTGDFQNYFIVIFQFIYPFNFAALPWWLRCCEHARTRRSLAVLRLYAGRIGDDALSSTRQGFMNLGQSWRDAVGRLAMVGFITQGEGLGEAQKS
jgi:hypothetical protein